MSKPRVHIFGQGDPGAMAQLQRCLRQATYGVLCADHHVGYSAPIGAAIAYPRHVSPSGVGYDIGCGNVAVRTPLQASKVDTAGVMDEIVPYDQLRDRPNQSRTRGRPGAGGDPQG